MKPILLVTNANFLGHLVRCIDIGNALRNAGVPVIFAASGRYEDILQRHRFTVIPLYTPEHDHTLDAIVAGNFDFYDLPTARRCVAEETACIRQVDPAAVVGDFRWTAKASAERCAVPYVSVVNILWTPYALRTQPPRAATGRGILARVRRRVPALLRHWLPAGRRGLADSPPRPTSVRSAFALLREELGLKPYQGLGAEVCGDLNLVPDLPELFPPRDDLPASFQYIGPLFGTDETLPTSPALQLPEKPYIYCSLSSAATPHMIRLALAAFGGGEIPVVMTTGRQAVTGELPANVHSYDFLPGTAVFNNAVAIVCYGGNGTIYRSLAHGTPIIGIATHAEQRWHLERIAELKLGHSFAQDSCRASDLRTALQTIVHDPEYRANCARYRTLIASSMAPQAAATAIIGFVERQCQP